MNFDYDKANEMLKRAKTGDQEAFAYLYEAYYKHAYSGTEHLGTAEDREDATQEAFVKFFAKLQAGEDITNFGSYVKNAARNAATDMIQAREAKKRINAESIIKPVENGDEEELNILDELDSDDQIMYALNEFYKRPDALLFEKESVDEIVKEVLDTLTTEQREALIMQFLQGYKQTEIADVYGVSVNTVKSYVNQGKAKAKKKILEIEKSRGIKIHGAAIVFVLAMFHTSVEAEAATLPVTGAAFVAANVATKAAPKGILATIKAFFSKSITVAGKTVSTKVIAIGTAGVVAAGSIGAAVVINQNEPDVRELVYELLIEERYEEACRTLEKEVVRDINTDWDGDPDDFWRGYGWGNDYDIMVYTEKIYREWLENYGEDYFSEHSTPNVMESDDRVYYDLIYQTTINDRYYFVYSSIDTKPVDSLEGIEKTSVRMDDSESVVESDTTIVDEEEFNLIGSWTNPTGGDNGSTILIRFDTKDSGFIGIGDEAGNFSKVGDHYEAHVNAEYLGFSEEESPGLDYTFTITPNEDGTIYINVESDPSWNRTLVKE